MATRSIPAAGLALAALILASAALRAAQVCAANRLPSVQSDVSVIGEDESVESPALSGSLSYSLYLPPGYTPANGPYSVIYLLHGVGGDRHDWLNYGRLRETADRLIAERSIPPVLIVMPEGAVSWWVDSGDIDGPGNYDTAVDRDLVAGIERRYAVLSDARGRAIGGLSMGAFGALRFALRSPQRYAAAAGLSPALWARIKPDTPNDERLQRVFRGSFGTPFHASRFVGMNPLSMIDALSKESSKPSLLLVVGSRDFPSLQSDTEELSVRLKRAGFATRYEMTEGGHDWQLWAAALPEVLRHLGGALRDPVTRGQIGRDRQP